MVLMLVTAHAIMHWQHTCYIHPVRLINNEPSFVGRLAISHSATFVQLCETCDCSGLAGGFANF